MHTHLEQWTHTHTHTHTHTWSSGRPGSSRGFGALLKGLTSVVDNSCQSRDSNPQPRITGPTLYPLEPRLPSINRLNTVYCLYQSRLNAKLTGRKKLGYSMIACMPLLCAIIHLSEWPRVYVRGENERTNGKVRVWQRVCRLLPAKVL